MDLLITLTRGGHDSRLKIVVDVGPDGVQHTGAVGRMREAGHHGVLFRDDDTELAPGTVQAVSTVGAAPHLIAVTLIPIVIGVGGAGRKSKSANTFILFISETIQHPEVAAPKHHRRQEE